MQLTSAGKQRWCNNLLIFFHSSDWFPSFETDRNGWLHRRPMKLPQWLHLWWFLIRLVQYCLIECEQWEKKAVGKVEWNEMNGGTGVVAGVAAVAPAAAATTPRPAPPASPTCFFSVFAFYNSQLQRCNAVTLQHFSLTDQLSKYSNILPLLVAALPLWAIEVRIWLD